MLASGTVPWKSKGGHLPSHPTLSRRVAASAEEGVVVLREGLQRLVGWRLKAMGGWRRPKTLVIDIDSLPVEVHGERPGSAWNGYYHRRVYHPIVASAGETCDILDLRLREGQVHTAHGGLDVLEGAGAGGAASVREGWRALRRGVSRRAANGGAWRSGARTVRPGCATTPC